MTTSMKRDGLVSLTLVMLVFSSACLSLQTFAGSVAKDGNTDEVADRDQTQVRQQFQALEKALRHESAALHVETLPDFLRYGTARARSVFAGVSWGNVRSDIGDELVLDGVFGSPFSEMDPLAMGSGPLLKMQDVTLRKWRVRNKIGSIGRNGMANGIFIQFLTRSPMARTNDFEVMLGYWEEPNKPVGAILDAGRTNLPTPLLATLQDFEKSHEDARKLELMVVEMYYDDFTKQWRCAYRQGPGYCVDLLFCDRAEGRTIVRYVRRSYVVHHIGEEGVGRSGDHKWKVGLTAHADNVPTDVRNGELLELYFRRGPVFVDGETKRTGKVIPLLPTDVHQEKLGGADIEHLRQKLQLSQDSVEMKMPDRRTK